MTLATLIKFLFGNREAILRFARCPQAIWIGLLFVFAAGFAREYDGEDLLHEPWHLLIPLAASLVSSAILYLLVRFVFFWRRGTGHVGMLAGYRTFLALYWLTAPLALVYAIPVERLLSAADAVRTNLWLLGLVATWRVLLMTRVVAVLHGASYLAALFVVMLFADAIAVVILMATPLPIVSFMGGIRLSESEEVLQVTVILLRALTVLSWPVWAIGTIVVICQKSPWSYQVNSAANDAAAPVRPHLWLTAGTALAVWAFILPGPQREQRLRRQAEQDLRGGRIREGLATMSAHRPSDFPPHWDPPPRISYHETQPDIVALSEQLAGQPVAAWVRDLFDQKFGNFLRGDFDSGILEHEPLEALTRHLDIIEQMPQEARSEIIREQSLEYRLGDASLPADIQVRIRRLLAEAGVEVDPPAEEGGPDEGPPDMR